MNVCVPQWPKGTFILSRCPRRARPRRRVFLSENNSQPLKVLASANPALLDDLAAGKLSDEIPAHGTLAKIRQRIPGERGVGAVAPEAANEAPVWLDGKSAL